MFRAAAWSSRRFLSRPLVPRRSLKRDTWRAKSTSAQNSVGPERDLDSALDEEDIEVEEEQYVETPRGQAETEAFARAFEKMAASQPGPSETGPERIATTEEELFGESTYSKDTPNLDYSPDGSDLDASLEAAFSEDSHAESQEATTLERDAPADSGGVASESTVEGNEVAPEDDPSYFSLNHPGLLVKLPKDMPEHPSKLPLRMLPYRVDPSFFPKATEEQYAAALVHGRSVHRPNLLPQTHGIPAATIAFYSYTPALLELFTHFASHAACSLGIPSCHPVPLPKKRTLWTVPRSPFVNKKSQENFERVTHRRLIKAWDSDPQVIDRWFMYLKRHALAGVGMRMVKWERAPLEPLEASMMATAEQGKLRTAQKGPARMRKESEHATQIKNLGKKIVKEEMDTLTSIQSP